MVALFVSIACLISLAQSPRNVSGVVLSEAGEPIPQIVVCADTGECSTTDQNGRFSIEAFREVGLLRYRGLGYEPLLKTISSLNSGDAVLKASDGKTWAIPVCKKKPKWANGLEFMLELENTRGAKIKKSIDTDYTIYGIQFSSTTEELVIASGLHWCSGDCLPFKSQIEASIEVSTKDLVNFNQPENRYEHVGIDSRGKLKDGSHWRKISGFIETIYYENVSLAASAFFDSIMDSICFQDPMADIYSAPVVSYDASKNVLTVDLDGHDHSYDISKAKMKGIPRKGDLVSVKFSKRHGNVQVSSVVVEVVANQ